MQKQWTDRAVKGAKYLAVGLLLVMVKEPTLKLFQGSYLMTMAGIFACSIVGPIIGLVGLYLIGTRHKISK